MFHDISYLIDLFQNVSIRARGVYFYAHEALYFRIPW